MEDASKQQDDQQFPFHTVGKIKIPKGQSPMNLERGAFWDERMYLRTWDDLEAHRLLGSVNELRKELYKMSASMRAEMNGAKLVDAGDINDISRRDVFGTSRLLACTIRQKYSPC